MPEKVDQFSHPQVSGETAMIDNQVAKKLLLDFGPFAGEPAAEQMFVSFTAMAWLVCVVVSPAVSTNVLRFCVELHEHSRCAALISRRSNFEIPRRHREGKCHFHQWMQTRHSTCSKRAWPLARRKQARLLLGCVFLESEVMGYGPVTVSRRR
jgi:hypothetical protein